MPKIQSTQNLYSHLKVSDIKLYQALDTFDANIRSISDNIDFLKLSLVNWRVPPVSHVSSGNPGDVSYDNFGNFFFCYQVNKWARIGSSGYSNTF